MTILDGQKSDYSELYYRWEHEQWAAGEIDLTEDRRQWAEDLLPELKRSFLWSLAPFIVGVERITSALVPFVDAAPTEEQQVFLTTQLVDGARHSVFFDRFYSEVLYEEGTTMELRLEAQVARLNGGSRTLLLETLPEVSDRIHKGPTDMDALITGVVLVHIILEGTIAMTVQRSLLDFVRERDLLPGFQKGIAAMARDGVRHLGFGVGFLKAMVAKNPGHADVVQFALEGMVPIALSVFVPPNGDKSYYEPLPYGQEELSAFALNSLRGWMDEIGVELPA